ncbi:MAG: hypothetical protein M3362_17455 [Acidobacteriota bacterium]|nr:hypothetical protein [Acidobacteriota bacterium]
MKRFYRTLLLFALVLASVGSIAWQGRDSKPSAKITVQHSNVDGVPITTLELDPIDIEHNADSYIILNVLAAYEDHSSKPKSVSISFHSRSQRCRFSDKADLLFVSDSDTITVHSGAEKSSAAALWVFSEPEGNICNESCAAFISAQTFLRITKSKHVEARLGPLRLQLGETQLNALRDFAVRISNPNGAV